MQSILVVDDEKDVHYSFRRILGSEGYRILSATSGRTALEKIPRDQPDLILLDIRLEDMNGLDLLKTIKNRHPESPVIVMTAFGTTQSTIEAMQRGAYDFIVKPFDVPRMKQVIREALEERRKTSRSPLPASSLTPAERIEEPIVGKSEEMRQIYKMIGNLAPRDVTVLITGESGTGKELIARTIHAYSPRSKNVFLPLNCSAIPETLFEGETFGYEKGAFTGAVTRKPGKVQLSDRGTLFLDEIGDMPLPIQPKILRFLQDGEFKPLGSNRILHADVRVIAATNKDLMASIQRGTFREDLFYRLNVVNIHIPPLRDRKEDIALLMEHFVQQFNHDLGLSIVGVAPDAIKLLQNHPWPGNVRELENCMKRAMVLSRRSSLVKEDFPGLLPPSADTTSGKDVTRLLQQLVERLFQNLPADPPDRTRLDLMARMEKHLITQALVSTQGNQVKAARLLGVSRTTLRSKIKRHGIA